MLLPRGIPAANFRKPFPPAKSSQSTPKPDRFPTRLLPNHLRTCRVSRVLCPKFRAARRHLGPDRITFPNHGRICFSRRGGSNLRPENRKATTAANISRSVRPTALHATLPAMRWARCSGIRREPARPVGQGARHPPLPGQPCWRRAMIPRHWRRP